MLLWVAVHNSARLVCQVLKGKLKGFFDLSAELGGDVAEHVSAPSS